jgi:hypothetical protein
MADVMKKTVEVSKPVIAKSKAIPAPKPRVTKKAVKPVASSEVAVPEIVPGIKENRFAAKQDKVKPIDDNEEFPVSKKVKTVEEWDDLDTPEMGDPSMLAEYAVEIFEYLKELEVSRVSITPRGMSSELKMTRALGRSLGSNIAQCQLHG